MFAAPSVSVPAPLFVSPKPPEMIPVLLASGPTVSKPPKATFTLAAAARAIGRLIDCGATELSVMFPFNVRKFPPRRNASAVASKVMPPTVRSTRSLVVTRLVAPAKVRPAGRFGSRLSSQFSSVLHFPSAPPPSQMFAAQVGAVTARSEAMAETSGERRRAGGAERDFMRGVKRDAQLLYPGSPRRVSYLNE